MGTTSLDGDDWQIRGCLGLEWRWHAARSSSWDAPHWVPATVPGSVIEDLHRAGIVPDPYHERNSLLVEWVPQRSWIYRRRLALRRLATGERAVVRFGGVDHSTTILLDGKEIATHSGAYVPFDVDMTEALRDGGEHVLAVVVHRAPESEPQVGISERALVHKSRMGYGWDFCPRMIHQGIWQSVELHVGTVPPRPNARTLLGEDLRSGAVEVDNPGQLTLLYDGKVVAKCGGRSLEIQRPLLWWPNGSGEQHLYDLLCTRDGAVTRCAVGFRRLELGANDGAPEDARPYTLIVNGRRLFAKGWNWTPIDPLYGVPRPSKLRRLLHLATAAHVNLLRVWGGGIVETEEFYGLCDELGILVWQELSLSSSGMGSVPPVDPGFVAGLAAEARLIVTSKRHHASLAIWCGGNELARSDPDRDDHPLDESTPVLGALRDVVRELDPDRSWLPTSPSGPRFLNRLDVIAADPNGMHDVHGPWEHQGLAAQHELYDAGTCLFHSEFGVEGMTSRRSHEALIDEGHRWPADRTQPVYEHLGGWWNNIALVQQCFGYRLGDLESLRRASQHLQHDGLRYAVEADMRRWPRCSGTIPWQFNESYPNAWCTSALDHRGDPKPAYYAVRSAYAPHHVCASFATTAWSGASPTRATVWAWGEGSHATARYVDISGATLAEERFAFPPDTTRPVRLGDIEVALGTLGSDVFLLDLSFHQGETVIARNRYLMSRAGDLAPMLDLPAAHVQAKIVHGEIRLSATDGVAAIGIVLEDDRQIDAGGWVSFSDNVVHLLPGESIAVGLDWQDAPREGRVVRFGGWNVAEQQLPVSAADAGRAAR